MALEDQIKKIVASYGAEFYDTEIAKEADSDIFRVYITHKDGVTLDLCADISNDLSPLFDVNPPLGGKYFLEVSSPGIERKLSKPRHFKSAIGERIKLKVSDGSKLKGILKSADDNSIVLDTKEGEKEYNYSDILKAKTYYDWSNSKS